MTVKILEITLILYAAPAVVPAGMGAVMGDVFAEPISVGVKPKAPVASDNCAMKSVLAAGVPVKVNATETLLPAQTGFGVTAPVVIVVCPNEAARQNSVAKMVRKLSLINVFFMYLSKYLSANLLTGKVRDIFQIR
jgi:hypothetical protein